MFAYIVSVSYAQQTNYPFTDKCWQVISGESMDYLGRPAFKGSGILNDVKLINGIIQFDICMNGQRSYPGIFFRMQTQADYEHIYFRPHRMGLYPDALQYTPVFNGIGAWQLYNGPGYTAACDVPLNQWIPVKIEIMDQNARVFINQVLVLEINQLQHGISEGDIMLNAPADGSAYFSNFSITLDEDIMVGPEKVMDYPVGMLKQWELSQVFTYEEVKWDLTPDEQSLQIEWEKVDSDEMGLIDIGKYRKRLGRMPDIVYARAKIEVEQDTLWEMNYGYSDYIIIFLNGRKICGGGSAYQQRDPSFLGIIGLHDVVYLPLKKGENELMISVGESFGGWGFMFQDAKKTYLQSGMSELWETGPVFSTSESVLYDPEREVLYVSNFDQKNMGNPNQSQSISKVSLTGEVLELNYINELDHPLGMTIHHDLLYITERNQVTVYDLQLEEKVQQISITGSLFLNDIAVSDQGDIYISDSRKNVIWKVKNDVADIFLEGEQILDPNTLYFENPFLYIGNSGDQQLKKVNIVDKDMTTVARFPEGFIDGIRKDRNGNWMVSLWKGKIYTIKNGQAELIFHSENTGKYTADFEFIAEKNLLIIPSFYGNTVAAFKLDNGN